MFRIIYITSFIQCFRFVSSYASPGVVEAVEFSGSEAETAVSLCGAADWSEPASFDEVSLASGVAVCP